MKTYLKTVHEEEYSSSEIKRTFGVLLNYSDDWKDSLIYVFNHKSLRYTFFNTMIDMINSQLYGDEKIKRAYMEEKDFDAYFDAEFIDGKFIDKLTWF
jgi:hypothetical protein